MAETKPRSDARLERSVILLVAALALVIVLTVNLFDRAPNGNGLASREIRTPKTRALRLLRQGWELYETQSNPNRVKRIFAEARRIAPNDPDVLHSSAQMALINKEFERAYNFYAKCHTYSAKSRRSYGGLAISLLCLKRYKEAESIALEGIKAYKLQEDLEFQLILACIYQKMGKNDLATKELSRAAARGRGLLIVKTARTQEWAAPLKSIDGFNELEETQAPAASEATEK